MEKRKLVRIKDELDLDKKLNQPIRWNTDYLFIDRPLAVERDFRQIQQTFTHLIEIGRYKGFELCPAIIIRKMEKQKKRSVKRKMGEKLELELDIKRVKAAADILDTISSMRITGYNKKAGTLTLKAWKELKQATELLKGE